MMFADRMARLRSRLDDAGVDLALVTDDDSVIVTEVGHEPITAFPKDPADIVIR